MARILVGEYQYYLHDSMQVPDWAQSDVLTDGVVAELGTGVKINTGIHTGPVDVTLTFCETEPPRPTQAIVAECDLELPSGVLQLSSGTTTLLEHKFGAPARCRVRAAVSGRDEAFAGGPPERHHITLWPSPRRLARWRSRLIDRIGTELQQNTGHVEA